MRRTFAEDEIPLEYVDPGDVYPDSVDDSVGFASLLEDIVATRKTLGVSAKLAPAIVGKAFRNVYVDTQGDQQEDPEREVSSAHILLAVNCLPACPDSRVRMRCGRPPACLKFRGSGSS